MKKIATTSTAKGTDPVLHDYGAFEAAVAAMLSAPGPLFATDADPEELWAAYLLSIPKKWRAHYSCSACRHFVKDYGGLVRVNDGGSRTSAVWPEDAPEFFLESVIGMLEIVAKSKITGVFLSSDPTLGTESNTSKKTGATWTHLCGETARPWRETILTASQKMAALREDHGVLCRSFAEYGEDVAVEALRVLKSDALDRATKAMETVEWYLKVLADRKSPALVWRHVATAPLGWCHIKNGVVSTLMDDVKNGVGFDVAKRKWAEKMHPLQYMRPQAAPSDGAIERAEKMVEKLGIARSLERRFARFDEIVPHALWTPRAAEESKPGGVFGHLRQKPEGVKRMQLPAKTISIEEFVRDILPAARHITVELSYNDNFVGVTTAVHADAPPILPWDYEDGRNPFAWYLYHGGSTPSSWGLAGGTNDVAAIMYLPQSWTIDEARRKIHESGAPRQLVFVLPGARDSRGGCPSLFPECMRGELHEVRSVIEAHNNGTKLAPGDLPGANGVALPPKNARTVTVDGDRYIIQAKG